MLLRHHNWQGILKWIFIANRAQKSIKTIMKTDVSIGSKYLTFLWSDMTEKHFIFQNLSRILKATKSSRHWLRSKWPNGWADQPLDQFTKQVWQVWRASTFLIYLRHPTWCVRASSHASTIDQWWTVTCFRVYHKRKTSKEEETRREKNEGRRLLCMRVRVYSFDHFI